MASELSLKTPSTGLVTLSPADTATDKTITLPATTGTMVVQDGTNTTTINNLAYTGTLTGGTGVVNIGSGQVYKATNGNVGIGTSAPTKKLQVVGDALIADGVNGQLVFENRAATNNIASGNSNFSAWKSLLIGGADIQFAITGIEKARIDSSGNLLVGTQSTIDSHKVRFVQSAAAPCLALQNTGSDFQNMITFYNASGTAKGSISSPGASSVAYNTSSDYRLKENVAPMTGALATVAQLKPCTYTWKADGSAGQGFIAHELQEVVPDCVTGTKDAVDAEGNPRYQGVDTSFLVATLVAAIQELSAQQTSLKAEFDAYKKSHP